MSYTQRLVSLVCATLCCLLLAVPPARAQGVTNNPPGLQLTVTPASVFFRLKPGASRLHTITLTNNGAQDVRVTPKLMTFRPDGTTGQPIIDEESDFPYIANRDAAFAPLVLPQAATAQLDIVLTIPDTAERREYPLVVLFVSEPAHTLVAQSDTVVTGIIGSNLVVSIGDERDFLLQVTDVKMTNLVDSFRGITFKPMVKNVGNLAQRIDGEVTISDWRGNQVAAFPLHQDMVLGLSTRAARARELEESPTAPLRFKPAFLLGPYKVTTTLRSMQSETQPEQATSSYSEVFFAFPIVLTALFLVGSSVLLLLRQHLIKSKKEYI